MYNVFVVGRIELYNDMSKSDVLKTDILILQLMVPYLTKETVITTPGVSLDDKDEVTTEERYIEEGYLDYVRYYVHLDILVGFMRLNMYSQEYYDGTIKAFLEAGWNMFKGDKNKFNDEIIKCKRANDLLTLFGIELKE